MAEDHYTRNSIVDILSLQKDKTIILYDIIYPIHSDFEFPLISILGLNLLHSFVCENRKIASELIQFADIYFKNDYKMKNITVYVLNEINLLEKEKNATIYKLVGPVLAK